MNAVTTHLDDLLMVLRASADLHPTAETSGTLQTQIAARLESLRPDLAAVIRSMDDWHADVLADFVAEAHVVAAALEYPPGRRSASDDTKVG